MSDQDVFERILASLHEAMLDDTAWPATSALIDEACGTVGNALLVGEGPLQSDCVGLYYRGQRREDWEREWLDVYQPINEFAPRFLQLPDSQMVFAPELYTAEELKTSRAYNEGLRQLDAQQSLMARLDGLDGCHIAWVSADPVGAGSWAAPQLALLKGLLPHIRQFVRVRQTLVNAEAQSSVGSALLDTTRVGVLHLDQRGRIMEANDRARAMLRQGDALMDNGGELSACVPADRARLARLVAAALPTSSAPAVSGSMLLRRTSVWPPFVVHVKPVGVRQPDFGMPRIAALVLITEPGSVSHIDPARVAASLGLTQVEGQIATWLAQGRTVHEIAVALELTAGAVRWHLHQIYLKHSLSRQADLVRLVLSVTMFA